MSDRPQYGEYATPEEQRRLAGLPEVDAAPEAAVATTPAVQQAPAATTPPPPRRWDRVITIGLLVYGAINVFMTGMSYLDLPPVLNESMRILGIDGEFTNFAQGRVWGIVAAGVLVLGWVITALLSIRRLRTGKITWWVPLVGAAVTTIAASVCISVAMMGDPAFIAHLDGGLGR